MMKYVIFQYKQLIMPVIIPEHVTHKQVSVEGGMPISAGFFTIKKGVVKCFGESESLKLKSRPEEDAKYIDFTLGGYGTMFFMDLKDKDDEK